MKFAAVADWIYQRIPAVLKLLFTEKDIATMIEMCIRDRHRAAILRFNNELLRDIPHTREEFIEALSEIDSYERYCEEHPDYKNNRATHAVANIKRVYDDRLVKHDFL